MHELAFDNIKYSFSNLLNHNLENEKKIRENEDLIDKLNDGIIKHISLNLSNDLRYTFLYIKITNEVNYYVSTKN